MPINSILCIVVASLWSNVGRKVLCTQGKRKKLKNESMWPSWLRVYLVSPNLSLPTTFRPMPFRIMRVSPNDLPTKNFLGSPAGLGIGMYRLG